MAHRRQPSLLLLFTLAAAVGLAELTEERGSATRVRRGPTTSVRTDERVAEIVAQGEVFLAALRADPELLETRHLRFFHEFLAAESICETEGEDGDAGDDDDDGDDDRDDGDDDGSPEELSVGSVAEAARVALLSGKEKWLTDPWKGPFVDSRHQLILCSIPKCGSTTLRKLAARLAGYEGWQRNSIHYWLHSKAQSRLHLGSRSAEQANRLLTDPAWRRVAVVRHPVTRLLSAYFNKIVGSKGWRYGRKHENMTFPEFIHRIEGETSRCVDHTPGKRQLDEHWEFQQCFCGLKTLKKRYEVYALEDAPQLVHSLVVSNHIPTDMVDEGWARSGDTSAFGYRTVVAQPQAKLQSLHKTEELVAKHYTRDLLDRVTRKYARDFAFFGFDPHLYDSAVTA